MAREGLGDAGERAMERVAEVDALNSRPKGVSVSEFFQVPSTVDQIVQYGFKRIALQFPDELLSDARDVATLLQEGVTEKWGLTSHTTGSESAVSPRVFVLGDTTFGSCCVDEVAAHHYNADSVVHYGRSCMSSTTRLPVIYVFGRQEIDTAHCVAQSTPLLAAEGTPVTVILFRSHTWEHATVLLAESLREALPSGSKVIAPRVRSFYDPRSPKGGPSGEGDASEVGAGGGGGGSGGSGGSGDQAAETDCGKAGCASGSCASGTCASESCGTETGTCASGTCASGSCASGSCRGAPPFPVSEEPTPRVKTEGAYEIVGHEFELDEGMDLKSCSMLYIGGEGSRLTSLLMRMNGMPAVSYNPCSKTARAETDTVNRDLSRRFMMMHKAKLASVVGIVAGTLGVSRYRNMVGGLRSLAREAGLASYTFVVGKINIEKLANFAEIDVFVVVACPETSILNSREFHKPVITPYEAVLAWNPSLSWTGPVLTEFQDVLPLMGEHAKQVFGVRETARDGGGGGGGGDGDGDGGDVSKGVGSVPAETKVAGETGASGDEEGDDDEEDAPFFSPITGGFSSRQVMGPAASTGPSGETSLVTMGERGVTVYTGSASGNFLSKREYQGLEPRIGETAVGAYEEGLSGIAASYDTETGAARKHDTAEVGTSAPLDPPVPPTSTTPPAP